MSTDHRATSSKPIILIVDDNPKNIQVVGNMIKKNLDCAFAVATDGFKALELALDLKPDLILLDIMMPRLNGLEVCEKLKSIDSTQDIPIIFLTAKTEADDIIRGFEVGAVDYVTKPFNSAELMARVGTQLALKQESDVIARQNEDRRELLHLLCHDLANPIASVITTMEFLENHPDAECRQELEKNALSIARNGLDIISMIRNFVALDENKLSVETENVNLLEALERSRFILKNQAEKKNITIHLQVDSDTWVVAERSSLINTVFNNLITNAIKFSYPNSAVSISERQDSDWANITFEDRGMGMPDSLARDVFNLSKATSREGTNGEKGTGFGMPLVRKLTRIYGGEVEIHSKYEKLHPNDHGTTVTLRLKKA